MGLSILCNYFKISNLISSNRATRQRETALPFHAVCLSYAYQIDVQGKYKQIYSISIKKVE